MFGGSMGHDWIFEVLRDLQAYARANALPALAAKAAEALAVAEVEITGQVETPVPPLPKGQEPH